jgi:hypothetical protein
MLSDIYKGCGILLLSVLLVPSTFGQISSEDVGTDKLAQTGFKFLKISPDARVAAMAGAMTAADLGSSVAMFYNPAGMASQTAHFSAAFSRTQWIADFNYSAVSAAFNTNRFGVFGVSLMFADYGDDIIGTVAAATDKGYLEYSELNLSNPSPSAFSVGLTYAISLTDRFSFGGTVKYASQDLGTALMSQADGIETSGNDLSTAAFDLGVLYRTGFRSLNFAMSVRNFAGEVNYVDENFELPLTFNVGLSMDMLDLSNMDSDSHSFLLAVEAERPRDYPEQFRLGGEYSFSNILFLRAGYVFPTDEEGINLGAGLRYDVGTVGFGVDYAYTSFGVFDNVQRFGLHLSF